MNALTQTLPNLSLEPAQILLGMLLALGLGLLVALTYRLSVPGQIVSPAMVSSMVILAMVAAMVMMVIGNNLARAFSLVGALAIIRFRTRLRSPWDITFIFFAIAAGIACGVFAFNVAVIGTVVTCLAVLSLSILPLSGPRQVHSLRLDMVSWTEAETEIDPVLDRHLRKRWLVEARSLRFGETLSFRYRIVPRRKAELSELLRELSLLEGVERVLLDIDEEASGDTS